MNCFAAIIDNYYLIVNRCEALVNNAEDIVRAEDLVFLAIEFDFRAAVFADQHAVALFDFKRDLLSVVVAFCRCRAPRRRFPWAFPWRYRE